MFIKLFVNFFVFDVLMNEGVMVMLDDWVLCQDICLLCIGLLNLMFKKIQMENQFVCLIGVILLQVELLLIWMMEYQIKNIVVVYMEEFYCFFVEVVVSGEKFDGLIIIGVLIEYLFFEEVIYWDEFQFVFDWI